MTNNTYSMMDRYNIMVFSVKPGGRVPKKGDQLEIDGHDSDGFGKDYTIEVNEVVDIETVTFAGTNEKGIKVTVKYSLIKEK